MSNKRVLITGAGGFVGSHVLRHILQTTDWDIVALDSFMSAHRGVTDRIHVQTKGHDPHRVHVYIHDLRVPISAQLDEKIGHIDYVYNLASASHVDTSIETPRSFIENNVGVVLTMLDWTLQRAYTDPVKKFIQISTDEVYGPALEDHRHSEGEPHRPSNPYSASKSAQESICFSYWRTYGLPIIISNTMNIIGEMQHSEKFIPKIIRCALEGESMILHASRTNITGSRFYLHARNQADALKWITDNIRPVAYSEAGVVDIPRFNVVGEREVSNFEMWEAVTAMVMMHEPSAMKTPPTLVDFHSSRPGHDLRYALDGTRLALAGWKAPVSLDESLERTVAWTLQHREWLR